MSVRMPSNLGRSGPQETALDLLGHEILAEKAAALGRSGERAEFLLARLREHAGEEDARKKLLQQTAEAVYAWFIQRELCGMRRHEAVIRDLNIPGEVLVRLGAR